MSTTFPFLSSGIRKSPGVDSWIVLVCPGRRLKTVPENFLTPSKSGGSEMPFFRHDGLDFHYREAGAGVPFVFQHGLGGDVNQPFGLFQPPSGFRLLAFDCRAHGQTVPLGDDRKISIAAFADDLAALLDHLSIPSAVVGG